TPISHRMASDGQAGAAKVGIHSFRTRHCHERRIAVLLMKLFVKFAGRPGHALNLPQRVAPVNGFVQGPIFVQSPKSNVQSLSSDNLFRLWMLAVGLWTLFCFGLWTLDFGLWTTLNKIQRAYRSQLS